MPEPWGGPVEPPSDIGQTSVIDHVPAIVIREAVPGDFARYFDEGFRELSEHTRHLRFFTAVRELPESVRTMASSSASGWSRSNRAAIMIIPFIASVMRDVFEITPPILRESAYGLGCTTWEVVRQIVLPYTQKGVVGGIMLGLGRALGETMAVTFVIGNSQRISSSLFAPGSSIASTLANEFGEADDLHLSALFALGLLLFVITLVVLSLAKIMILRAEKAKGTKT